MLVIETWTGETATALQRAMRLTNEAFANNLGIAVRTVANWHARPTIVPSPDLQQVLDTAHAQSSEEAQARFAKLAGLARYAATDQSQKPPARDLGPEVLDTSDWLDERSALPPGTSERTIAIHLDDLDRHAVRTLANKRARITRTELASAIAQLYEPTSDYELYGVTIDGETLRTTMLTTRRWLCAALPLVDRQDRFQIVDPPPATPDLDALTHAAAIRRLAEIVAAGTHFFDAPLYTLRDVDISDRGITGRFTLSNFREYALTTDLISIELIDALTTASDPAWSRLPLRRRYLPTLQAAADLTKRGPAGGVLSLFAAARPADRLGQEPDYLLLVQERSRQVLNANAQLAVIPKAFHQPMVNFTDDAHLAATLTRELEEELFGRPELELGAQGIVDPTHPTRLSAPMRWLMDHRDSRTWQMDCTGFGINLLSGNFEFSVLTVIHDERWWAEFGGQVMANWEASQIQQFSSRDTLALRRLVCDDRWSNEGLFALVRGLRRLAEIAPDRVKVPEIVEEI